MGEPQGTACLTLICLAVSAILFLGGSTSTDTLTSLIGLSPQSNINVVYVIPQIKEHQELTATAKKAVFAYDNVFTAGEITHIAAHFDLCILNEQLHPVNNLACAAAVKAAAPATVILVYRELHMMYTGYDDWATVNANEAWFLHTAGGARIQETTYGWYLMDPASAGWRAHLVSVLNTVLSSANYDGCFLDDAHDEVPNWWTLSGSIQAADIASWHNDVLGLIQYVKANLTPGELFFINSDQRGEYDYAAECDGIAIEYFSGKQHVDDLAYVTGPLGKTVIALSISNSNPVPDAAVKYYYSQYLLGASDIQSFFAFNDWNSTDGEKGYYNIMDVDIGDSDGAYFTYGGVLKRNFTNGAVYVNLSPSNLDISIGDGLYDALTGESLASNQTMLAYSGLIVKSTPDEEEPPIEPPPATYYTVVLSHSAGGSLNRADGSYNILTGEAFTVKATPSSNYVFTSWTRNGAVVSSNPTYSFTFYTQETLTLTASFTYITPPTPSPTDWTLIINVASGGITSPAGGSHIITALTKQVTFTPLENYDFSYYTLDGTVGTTSPLTITSAYGETHTLNVYWKSEAQPDPITPPAPPAAALVTSTLFGKAVTQLTHTNHIDIAFNDVVRQAQRVQPRNFEQLVKQLEKVNL